MEEYKKKLATILAETGALFFDKNLVLKDGRPTPYFVNGHRPLQSVRP
jgi:orotate phosphoribosyltransferase